MQQRNNGARSVTPWLCHLTEREPDVEQDQHRGCYHGQECITRCVCCHRTRYRSIVQQLSVDVSIVDKERLEFENVILRKFSARQQSNRLRSRSLAHINHTNRLI